MSARLLWLAFTLDQHHAPIPRRCHCYELECPQASGNAEEDGTLFLKGLPFQAGERVEVIILALPTEAGDRDWVAIAQKDLSLADEVTEDYLDAVAATLTEWGSPADDLAYQDL